MFEPPYGKPWLLYGLLGCSLALNLVMVLDRTGSADDEVAVQDPAAGPAVTPATATPGETTAFAATDAAAAPSAVLMEEWNVVDATVEHSLARTFQKAVGADGDVVSAVFARLFVWDLDLRRDLQSGDRVEVAWKKLDDGQVEIAAARLHSSKYGRTFTAYRWHAPGDAFSSYWQEEGTEVPYRLVNGPIAEYEQVTSLLKDRPTHKGMDFKTPVGTPVVSPKAGVVTRDNFNWNANGNCLEVRQSDGTLALYLHLSENKVKTGDSVAAGQLMALSGNTGRSTAPHLHYQLMRGDKVLDPIDYHGTVRRRIEGATLAEFQRDIADLDALLGGGVVARR